LLIILKLPNLSSLGVVTSAPQASVLATLTGATAAVSITVYAPDNGAFTADCNRWILSR
jgi:hypothetical protein